MRLTHYPQINYEGSWHRSLFSSDASHLDGLHSLASVSAYFCVDQPSLTDIGGLSSLTNVGSWFFLKV